MNPDCSLLVWSRNRGTLNDRNAGETADESAPADAPELLHLRRATENGAIAQLAMAGNGDDIGKRDVVAHHAVVAYMRTGHEEAIDWVYGERLIQSAEAGPSSGKAHDK